VPARRRSAAHDVFISYAQRDRDRAEAIVEALEGDGLRCWIAPRNVNPGAPYAEELVAAIASSRVVLVVFSQAANDSDAVLNELEIAFNRHVPIVPVRLERIEPHGSAEFYLRRRHWFDVHDDLELRLAELVRSVRAALTPAAKPRGRARPAAPAKAERLTAHTLLVGREAELTQIADAIEKAEHAHGPLLILRGEPGIGKTALLDAALERARDAGFVTASAVNFEHTRTPLGPWTDLLRSLEETLQDIVPPDPVDRAAYYQLLGLRDEDANEPAPDGRRLFVIIVEALQRAAQRSPLLLALDDIQWADPETVELLDFATPRLATSRVLIVLTQRAGSTAPAAVAISALGRYPAVRTIDVHGISDVAVRQLIASMSSSGGSLKNAMIDEICRRSDGNPLFAAELVRDASSPQGGNQLLPQSVQLSVVLRFRTLTPDDARILETAAVVGRTFSVDDLVALSSCDRLRVVRALRSARDAGLIEQPSPGGEILCFRHELFRAAVYAELLSLERTEIHRSVAELLTARDSTDFALLAYHWQRAGDLDRTCRYAIQAGDEATRVNAHASARDAYTQAIETNQLSDGALADIHDKLGVACDALGDAAEAARHFGLSAEFHRDHGDSGEAARLELRFAANAYRAGRGLDVISSCERVVAEVEEPKLLYGAHAILAQFYSTRGDFEAAWLHIQAADGLGIQGNVRDQLSVEWARAVASEDISADAAIDAARAAVRLAEVRGTPSLLALNLMNFAIVSAAHGHNEETSSALARSIAIADSQGATYTSAYARCVQAQTMHLHGALLDAYRLIAYAISLHVDALIVRVFIAAVGLDIIADLGMLEAFPALQDPQLLEAAFESGEEGRYAPLAAAHVHALAMGGAGAAAATIVKRALASVKRFSTAATALVVFARYGNDDDVAAIEALLPPDAPPGPQLLDLRVLQAIVATRLDRAEAKLRGKIALEQVRIERAPLLEAYILELLGEKRKAVAIYRQVGARGHLLRLSSAERRGSPKRGARSSGS
jgi:hypothetical protein